MPVLLVGFSLTLQANKMATPSVTVILDRIAAAGKAYKKDDLGSREALIDLSRDLVAALEIPSEFLQRSFWAEVRLLYHVRILN